jgi:hypothetical protein
MLVLVLPVAIAIVERCFSAMKIVKSSLSNRMGDQHLRHRLICYVDKEEMKLATRLRFVFHDHGRKRA